MEKVITKKSNWDDNTPSKEKLWEGYSNFPLWLKGEIEKEITKCKRGDHCWMWTGLTTNPEIDVCHYRCLTKGCEAEGYREMKK